MVQDNRRLRHLVDSLVEDGEASSGSIDAKDENGMTALLRAASDQNRRDVMRLLKDGADPSVADAQGLRALDHAAFYGRTKLAQTLIEHGPAGLVFCESPGGETSLWIACAYGHLNVVKMLIEVGGEALVHKNKKDGCSCLHIACQNGHLEVAKALINAGGDALLHLTHKDGYTCLHIACYTGHLETVKALIKAGGEALLLQTQKDGYTCLHLACREGHLEIAKTLIEAGGEALLLKTYSGFGLSCLHTASHSGRAPVVAHLRSLCACIISLRDGSGRTPLEPVMAPGQGGVAEDPSGMWAASGPRGAS